jgi:hypothetical protein
MLTKTSVQKLEDKLAIDLYLTIIRPPVTTPSYLRLLRMVSFNRF